MNSFNTDEDTEKIVRKYTGFQVNIYSFNQSCFPRISRDSLLPVARRSEVTDNMEAWYPPGHGDFYESFQNSGLLKQFIGEGREYLFLSNIDNLGATIDLGILNRVRDGGDG
jgi:UTP--glucose-1-phosphate uridylyltransferase